jgi:hypothetical protein
MIAPDLDYWTNPLTLSNAFLRLDVPQGAGPRILGLRYRDGPNLLAELPDIVVVNPAGQNYRFLGGHRLWRAPEDPLLSYLPEENEMDVQAAGLSLTVTAPPESQGGLQKSLSLALDADRPRLTLKHAISNVGQAPVTFAAWAITQLVPGGTAIIPQETEDTGLLPNRRLTLWPYTDIQSPHFAWGNRYVRVSANMTSGKLKLGLPNSRGWLGYWIDGLLFVKSAPFDEAADYPDGGCSSEVYCGPEFIELETLSPLKTVVPGEQVEHREVWQIYELERLPGDEAGWDALVARLELDLRD